MNIDEKLFSALDNGFKEFMETNPTRDDVELTKQRLSELLNSVELPVMGKIGIEYILGKLGGAN